MKTITIRELHNGTGELVRAASRHGAIQITDDGRVVARIMPQTEPPRTPYFDRRKPSATFKRLDASGKKTGRGTGSTMTTSAVREDRA